MDFKARIENKIFSKKKVTGKESFEGISFILAKELGWSYLDIITSPSPFVLEMVDKVMELKKAEEKAMKKRK